MRRRNREGERQRERVVERFTNPSPPSAQTLGFNGLSRRPEVCLQSTTAIYDLPQCTISLCGLLKQRQHNPTVAALFEVICCHSEGKDKRVILAKKNKKNKWRNVFLAQEVAIPAYGPFGTFLFSFYYPKVLVLFFQPCLTFSKQERSYPVKMCFELAFFYITRYLWFVPLLVLSLLINISNNIKG